jgi:hypothetical protein
MKQHRLSTAAMTLVTVAALVVTAWASSAVADQHAGTRWALAQQGMEYEVFRRRDDRPEHQGALVYVIQTRKSPQDIAHGLVFLQTRGSAHGEGFVRGICEPMQNDRSLKCHQDIGNSTETMIIGAINSKACKELRKRNEKMASKAKTPEDREKLQTPEGKNPVATPEECGETHPKGCVCYDISSDDTRDFPPNSGSGTGGHN